MYFSFYLLVNSCIQRFSLVYGYIEFSHEAYL
nr:MAG TPA: hypothetical protein [Caudoviricetes sp.]